MTIKIESMSKDVVSLLWERFHELDERWPDPGRTRSSLREVGLLLKSLPLKHDQFLWYAARLEKAERFLESCEAGAARWEIDALRRHLARWGSP